MKNEEKQRIGIAAPSVFGFVTLPSIEAQDLAAETIVDTDPQFAAHEMNFNGCASPASPDYWWNSIATVTRPDT
ncbi:hypothetical protein NKI88_29510 [Mesorhizobium sp. M0317]|uniref:hypothetical protein n=1 Tax=unclassified Mesorhizobium TaxID=325217 RepID=UPI0003D02A5B|nr:MULTISPECIES: hypothetical protein [unclassified Mesorhizobium]ESZ03449.1 hypothetical protein X736_25745 [Mesorhizobium sp. L2C089B000]ESZ24327.1 hypothetical protein X733_32110 [Mesorhizobium sp. L2C067A000]ESZ34492.1 hypothetical protein X731_31035 [Mesorhizobium sp. L2C054A000]WJI50256.1 hypothetical protein NLY44_27335 [Mesorhizobium sp. C089B]